jgi:hypothetical protein
MPAWLRSLGFLLVDRIICLRAEIAAERAVSHSAICRVLDRMAQGIAGGFTAPPQETGFEIYNEVTPSRAQLQGSCPATG